LLSDRLVSGYLERSMPSEDSLGDSPDNAPQSGGTNMVISWLILLIPYVVPVLILAVLYVIDRKFRPSGDQRTN